MTTRFHRSFNPLHRASAATPVLAAVVIDLHAGGRRKGSRVSTVAAWGVRCWGPAASISRRPCSMPERISWRWWRSCVR